MTTFSDLQLAAPLLKALAEEGYTTPTPIQAQAIPPVMAGSDLLGIAQTGTGKTAAFALPILHRLANDKRAAPRKGCRALILSPTRELASQIGESFRTYGGHLNIRVATVFGGVSFGPQARQLDRGVDILIATPGRLIDHMTQRTVALESTEVFVLDEADQMLDLGFLPPIRKIVAKLSTRRQNLFFSATMPREIGKLADELLNNPVKVSVAPASTTVERVAQRVIHVEPQKKKSLLIEIFANADVARALVFTRTKRGADKVAKHLEGAGIGVAAIHGNKSQRQREEALQAFRSSKIRVLVATDIAARGIDIDNVTHVVNYELPEVPESYVHRIGRTARAGASGNAISLCAGDERGLLRDIERTTRQVIPSEDRRGDSALAVETKAAAGADDDRNERGPRRDFGQRRDGARNGAREGGREGRRDGGGRGARSGDRGPRANGGEHRSDARRSERDMPSTTERSADAAVTPTTRPAPEAHRARPEHRRDENSNRSERNFADKPRSERPRGDKFRSDKPRSDAPRGDRNHRGEGQQAAGHKGGERSFGGRRDDRDGGERRNHSSAPRNTRDDNGKNHGHRARSGAPPAQTETGAAPIANVAFLKPAGQKADHGPRPAYGAKNGEGQQRRESFGHKRPGGSSNGQRGAPNRSGKPGGGWSGQKRSNGSRRDASDAS